MKRKLTYRAASKQDLELFHFFIFLFFFAFVCGCSIRKIQLFIKSTHCKYQLCYCRCVPVRVVGCQGNVVLLVGSSTFSVNSDLYADTDS